MFIDSVVDELPVALGSVNRKDIENIAFFLKNLPPKSTIDESKIFFSENLKFQFLKKSWQQIFFFERATKKGLAQEMSMFVVKHLTKTTQGRGRT